MRLQIEYPDLAAALLVAAFTAAVHGYIELSLSTLDGADLNSARPPYALVGTGNQRPGRAERGRGLGEVNFMSFAQERQEQIAVAALDTLDEQGILVGIEHGR